ncbi:unnamed protein product [Trichogramma brassicae]|uniref:Uncharacterized protein n=1 Tax=Trichogramma brassicae TaxID=86971 RepID=A0A6H5I6H8_9HYME|nr:unnamed protein product [Trichogramma brassicae]
MKCTQFKLGDHKDIKWFKAVSGEDFGPTRVIHNLPEGQGFLTVKDVAGGSPFKDGKYLVKIGLDGRPTQLKHARMTTCPDNHESTSTKLFNDDKGHYGLSVACIKTSKELFTTSQPSSYLQFESKIFGPDNSDQMIQIY